MPFATKKPQRVQFARWTGDPGAFPFTTAPYRGGKSPCGICRLSLNDHAVAVFPNGHRQIMCKTDVVVWSDTERYKAITAAEFASMYQEEPEP